MKKRIILSIIFLSVLISCSYDVHIKKDGSAHVQVEYGLSLDGEKEKVHDTDKVDMSMMANLAKESPLVTNFESKIDKYGITIIDYDINNIDSLGRFVTTGLEFRLLEDKFLIKYSPVSDESEKAEEDDDKEDETKNLNIDNVFKLNVSFKKKIKKILSKENNIVQTGKKTIQITSGFETFEDDIIYKAVVYFK